MNIIAYIDDYSWELFVNQEKITKKIPLKNGDILKTWKKSTCKIFFKNKWVVNIETCSEIKIISEENKDKIQLKKWTKWKLIFDDIGSWSEYNVSTSSVSCWVRG